MIVLLVLNTEMNNVSKNTPITNEMRQMVSLVLLSNHTRSEMIAELGVSRETFYRWMKDLRVRAIFKDFDRMNLEWLTSEIRKRWAEKITVNPRTGPTRKLVPKATFGNSKVDPKQDQPQSFEDKIFGY